MWCDFRFGPSGEKTAGKLLAEIRHQGSHPHIHGGVRCSIFQCLGERDFQRERERERERESGRERERERDREMDMREMREFHVGYGLGAEQVDQPRRGRRLWGGHLFQ